MNYSSTTCEPHIQGTYMWLFEMFNKSPCDFVSLGSFRSAHSRSLETFEHGLGRFVRSAAAPATQAKCTAYATLSFSLLAMTLRLAVPPSIGDVEVLSGCFACCRVSGAQAKARAQNG